MGSVLHPPIFTAFGHGPHSLELQCSWSPVIESPDHSENYKLVVLDVNIKVQAERTHSQDEKRPISSPNPCPSDGLTDLLTTVHSSTPLIPETFWSGRVIVAIHSRPGYLVRSKCFQQRLIGCSDLGILHDRTIFGQYVSPRNSDGQDLHTLLNSSVFMLIRPASHTHLDETSTIQEIHARINFPWLLTQEPKPKTLAIVDGHLNLQSYLPFYNSAAALGIDFVLLDSPIHWITQPQHRHLYKDFLPIDMTPDNNFPLRIAAAVKAYGPVDGICAIASYCLLPVAQAATILGLPTEDPSSISHAVNKHETRLIAGGAEPTVLVTGAADLIHRIDSKAFIPEYPLIIKPTSGTGSAHVYKADTETELLEGVTHTANASNKKVLIEAYIDGPEVDVNFVLLDGEILFFEIADDFPSPGDNDAHGIPVASTTNDFWENTNVLPSTLPTTEYALVRETLHRILQQVGLKTGVFHLEARIQNSSMQYTQQNNILDLRPTQTPNNKSTPTPFLIEINPRPPGMPCIISTATSYGINLYDLHLLASLNDTPRLRALSTPFTLDPKIPNNARTWTQLIWLRADKGGICASDDPCGEYLLQKLSPADRALVTESVCFFTRGQRVPDPVPGVVCFGAFFVVSGRERRDVLGVGEVLKGFKVPVV